MTDKGEMAEMPNTPDREWTPADLLPFVPEGYEILSHAFGDLNQDQVEDAVLVLTQEGEDTLTYIPDELFERPLIILLGQKGNVLKPEYRNDKVVLCRECGGVFGDPFESIEIDKGAFTVHHYGGSAWRWSRNLTFTYDKDQSDFVLKSDHQMSFHAMDPGNTQKVVERTMKDFGTVLFKDFDVYDGEY